MNLCGKLKIFLHNGGMKINKEQIKMKMMARWHTNSSSHIIL